MNYRTNHRPGRVKERAIIPVSNELLRDELRALAKSVVTGLIGELADRDMLKGPWATITQRHREMICTSLAEPVCVKLVNWVLTTDEDQDKDQGGGVR